jgi:predicted phosphodiesterase
METPARQVAVLSDVHGVLPALECVLAEPEVAAADRIVLTGDLAAGPQPRETLDLLASLGDRAVWIRGNADRELVQLARGEVSAVPSRAICPIRVHRISDMSPSWAESIHGCTG